MTNKPFITAKVIDLDYPRTPDGFRREWKHRLAGYGYTIKDTEHGRVVETCAPYRSIRRHAP
jgi:hypothetical protein